MPGMEPRASGTSRPVALKALIGAHLDKVLSSGTFTGAESLRELLSFTVNETIAGRGGDLKEYLLAVAVLGKKDSFDPKADPIVRVQMGRLRRRLLRYYAGEGQEDMIVIDIPTGTYTPVFRESGPRPASTGRVASGGHVVGRDREMAELLRTFESVAEGQGRVLCLTGEPGIGKTTVVETFLKELPSSCHVARGRCSESLAGSDAYLPVLEALEHLLRAGGESLGRTMSTLAPAWYVRVAPPGDPFAKRILAEDPLASQERLKREMVALFSGLARDRPVVLFFDDLHWADPSTVDLLGYCGIRWSGHRILVVGAYRPSYLIAGNNPLLSVKLEMQARGLCREISMPFLTHTDVERYLALEFPAHQFPAELSARVHRRTEGNPLFMADLLNYLRDRGVLAQQQGRWVASSQLLQIEHEIPESVRSLIEKKISQLNAIDRRLLTTASVQGYEFDSAVVARACEMDPAEVEDRLETLDRAHSFVRLGGDRELPDGTLSLLYSFVHVLYQDALHSELTATRQASLSLAVAQVLARTYADRTNEVASQLALLFETGRDFARASDYFLMAARNAARICAARESIALAERAIGAAGRLTGPDRHSRVATAAFHSALQLQSLTRFGEAVGQFDLAESEAGQLGDSDAQINAIYSKAFALFIIKRIPEMSEQATRALNLAEGANSPSLIASSKVLLASAGSCLGDVDAAQLEYDRSIPVLEQHGSLAHAQYARLMRGFLHASRLEHEKADRDLEWGYERAKELGLGFDMLLALFSRARTRGNQGLFSDAWVMLEEGLRSAELLGDYFCLVRFMTTRGWLLSEMLDGEAALRLNTEAVHIAGQLGDVESGCHAHINLAHDYLTLSDYQRASEHLRKAEALHSQDTWFRWVSYPRIQAEWSSYWIARGDLKQALSAARDSLHHAAQTMTRKRMAWAHKLLGDIAVLEDRVDDGRREFDSALGILDTNRCPTIEWQILRAASEAARLEGDEACRLDFSNRAHAVVESLAASIRDDERRDSFERLALASLRSR